MCNIIASNVSNPITIIGDVPYMLYVSYADILNWTERILRNINSTLRESIVGID